MTLDEGYCNDCKMRIWVMKLCGARLCHSSSDMLEKGENVILSGLVCSNGFDRRSYVLFLLLFTVHFGITHYTALMIWPAHDYFAAIPGSVHN